MNNEVPISTLPLGRIRLDGGTQLRAKIDEGVINDYAEALRTGGALPPVTVFQDGKTIWLADGFHRYKAHYQAKEKHILAYIHKGTLRDAVLFAVGANASHGLRRSNADKRRAVEALLKDEEWSSWSNCEIARRCAVSDHFVGVVRAELSPIESGMRRAKRGDQDYEMDVSGISADMSAEVFAALPPAAQVELMRAEEQEERTTTRTAPDDGLRLLSIRIGLPVMNQLDTLCERWESDRAAAVEKAVKIALKA